MKHLAVIGTTIIIALSLLLFVGWVKNFVKFIDLDFEKPYKAEIIRGIGLSSYGAIIGWIDIKD